MFELDKMYFTEDLERDELYYFILEGIVEQPDGRLYGKLVYIDRDRPYTGEQKFERPYKYSPTKGNRL